LERRVALLLALLVAAAPARAQGPAVGGQAPVVASVKLEMRGGGQVPPDLQGLVAVAQGQPLSGRAVRRSIERLFSTGRFSDVVARGEEGPDGLVVTFELAPVVRISRIDVTGARSLGKDELLTAARLQVGNEYWPEKLDEARTALLAAYARRGWNQAQINATAQPSGDKVVVKLEIHEGEPTRVRALRFEGQPGLSTGRLSSAFGLRVGDILDRTRLDPGAESLRTLYRDTGHARARVGAPRVSLEATGAVVTVPVEAGPAFTLRSRETGGTRPPGSTRRWRSIRPRPWTARCWSARRGDWRPSTATVASATCGSSRARW